MEIAVNTSTTMNTTTSHLISLLDSTFTTSFKHTSAVLYDVAFKDSNISSTLESLNKLETNLRAGVNTGKHVGYPITVDDVLIVKDTLNAILIRYKERFGLTAIPSNSKIYTIMDKLKQDTQSAKEIAKEVLEETYKPLKEDPEIFTVADVKARRFAKGNKPAKKAK